MMLKLIFMFKFQEFKAIFGLYLSVSLEAGAGERTATKCNKAVDQLFQSNIGF